MNDHPESGISYVHVNVGGREWTLPASASPVRVGRGADASVRIEPGVVSREHLLLVAEGGDWVVVDQSERGTFTPDGSRVDRLSVPAEGLRLHLNTPDGLAIEVSTSFEPSALSSVEDRAMVERVLQEQAVPVSAPAGAGTSVAAVDHQHSDGTAGPLDRLLMTWQRWMVSLTSRIPRWILVVALVGGAAWGVFRLLRMLYPADVFWVYGGFFVGMLEILLFARTRTVSLRTVLTVTTAGASLTSMVLVATVSLHAALFGIVAAANPVSYGLITPLVEEAFKVVPVLLILAASHRARNLTILDVGLLGFVSGLGFSLSEELTRGHWFYAPTYDSLTVTGFPADPVAPITAMYWEPFGYSFWSHSLASFLVAISIGFVWHFVRTRGKRVLVASLLLPVAAYAYVVSLHGSGNLQGLHLSSSATYLAPFDWLFEWLGPVDALRPLAFGAFALAFVVDFSTLYRSDPKVMRYLLPAIDRSGLRATIAAWRQRRVQRLALASRTYGAADAPLDVWTDRSLSRAGLLLILVLAIGVGSLVSVPGTAEPSLCATCVFNQEAGLPAWLLALFGLFWALAPGSGSIGGEAGGDAAGPDTSGQYGHDPKEPKPGPSKKPKPGAPEKPKSVPTGDGPVGQDFDSAPDNATEVVPPSDQVGQGWAVDRDDGQILVSDTTGDGQPDRGWFTPNGGGDREYWVKGDEGTWKQVDEDTFFS